MVGTIKNFGLASAWAMGILSKKIIISAHVK